MVRQTKTITETIKEAQSFLKKLVPRRANRSIRETIEDATRFLQRGTAIAEKRRQPQKKVAEPIQKKIKKDRKSPAKAPKVTKAPAVKKPEESKKPKIVQQIVAAVVPPKPEPLKVKARVAKPPKVQPPPKKVNKPAERKRTTKPKPITEEQPPQKRVKNIPGQVQVQPPAVEVVQEVVAPPPAVKEEAAGTLKSKRDVKQEMVKEEPQRLKQAPRRTYTDQSDLGKPAAGIVDVVFVVDTTGSMDEYLEMTKDTVNTLVARIRSKTTENDISVRFGFVAYRDHPPQEDTYVTRVKDLCPSEEILKFIDSLDCHGGGDGAEAVLDGLNEAATKIGWRREKNKPDLRYIFHIGDQPPHGREYGGYSETWEAGCPCHLTLDKVAHSINIREIHYRLIKASNTRLEEMARLFKEKFVNYEDTRLEGEAKLMDIRITDMVIRELLPDYDYE